MEYSQIKIQGGKTSKLTCNNCSFDKFNIVGKINYAFLFLESIPFYPLKKELILTCEMCNNIYENSTIESKSLKSLRRSLFKIYLIIPMYTGLILSVLALFYWQYTNYKADVATQTFISSPHANDFYYLDYRGISTNLRPHEVYRLAKVSTTGDGVVSLVYGSFLYRRESSLEKDLSGGMIVDSRYFGEKRHIFSLEKLQELYDNNTILAVKRPTNNRLYGNIVVSSTSTRDKSVASRLNEKGLALMRYSHVKENLHEAHKHFLKSAELDFTKGQVNLSYWYLSDGKLDKAMYWLKIASFKGNRTAVRLYMENCNKVESCNIEIFKKDLKSKGHNLEVL